MKTQPDPDYSGDWPLPVGAATQASLAALLVLIGEVQASPTANTLLARLKAVADALPGLAATQWGYAAASGGIANTTTAVTIKAAAGAGVRNVITSLQLFAPALGAATELAIRDGAGGAVLWRANITTAGINQQISLSVPIIGSLDTLLEVVTLTATVTGGVYVNAQGFTR